MTNPINYDPNTPGTKLAFADWQIQFIQNFTQLSTAFSQNHIPLNDSSIANRGNHTYVQMPEQSDDPQTGSVEFSIYTKNVDSQTDQIYFTYPGNTPIVQFTNYQIYSVNPTVQQTTYFTFLPGGLLIYFGTFTSNGQGKNTLFLNPPVAKNVISLNLCPKGTTPKYTPEVSVGTFSIDPSFKVTQNDIIKEIYVIPNIKDTGQQQMYYLVVANT